MSICLHLARTFVADIGHRIVISFFTSRTNHDNENFCRYCSCICVSQTKLVRIVGHPFSQHKAESVPFYHSTFKELPRRLFQWSYSLTAALSMTIGILWYIDVAVLFRSDFILQVFIVVSGTEGIYQFGVVMVQTRFRFKVIVGSWLAGSVVVLLCICHLVHTPTCPSRYITLSTRQHTQRPISYPPPWKLEIGARRAGGL
jgi:hypothetical protein